jgi:hypothetical protein
MLNRNQRSNRRRLLLRPSRPGLLPESTFAQRRGCGTARITIAAASSDRHRRRPWSKAFSRYSAQRPR